MRRFLWSSLDPVTVDFSDPAPPPRMTAEKIHAGVKLALADMPLELPCRELFHQARADRATLRHLEIDRTSWSNEVTPFRS